MPAPQPSPPPNTGMIIVYALLIWAAWKDSAYKRAGGVRPDRFEKILLASTIGGSVLVIFLMALRSPGAAGTLSGVLFVVIFGVWEIFRWRIRKKHPVVMLKK